MNQEVEKNLKTKVNDQGEYLTISLKGLEGAFPFYLLIERNLKIHSFGKSMRKLFPEIAEHSQFDENWTCVLNGEAVLLGNDILKKTIHIWNKGRVNLIFKGRFEWVAKEERFLFLGVPQIKSNSDLERLKLSNEDFSMTEPMLDLLGDLKQNESVNNDLKKLLYRLEEQKLELSTEKQNLQRKELMLKAIASATDVLLSGSDVMDAISSSLQLIGEAAGVDRTYLFQNAVDSNGNVLTSQRFEWNAGVAEPQINNPDLQEVPIEIFADFLPSLHEKKPFEAIVSRLSSKLEIKAILAQQDILSILIIPIFLQGEFWGFVGYDDCHKERVWAEDEVYLLKTFSNSISSALEKFKHQEELHCMALFHLESPDPVIRIDRDGEVLLMNDPAKQIKKPILKGKQRETSVFFRFLARYINEENPSGSLELKCGNKYYSANAKLLTNGSHINIYLNDITRQKEAELEIKKSNEQLVLLKNIIANSSDALQVSYEDGKLMYINDVASDRLGINPGDEDQYSVFDFEKVFKVPGVWKEHVEELKKIEYLTIEGENIHQGTGEVIPVEVTVKYIKIGDQGFVVANSRDISERKQNERQLRLQEEKYRNIISNMNLGLIEVDNNETIQFCNKGFEEISGYECSEMRGKNALELFVDREGHKKFKHKRELRKNNISDSYEFLVKNKRGEARWWLISGAPNYNDKGEIIGSIGIHLDITDQKRMEEELEAALIGAREASEAKESFLTNMSHEIRTPLNGIIGMIRELKKERLTPKQKRFVTSTDKASQHLLSIINNILDITKIEAGELELEKRHFSLTELLEDVQSILNSNADEKEVELEVQVHDEVAEALVGDEARLRQILLNLAGNSIKFTEEGCVSIQCCSAERTATHQVLNLTIKDTGVGMDEEYIKRVFSKFQQEDASISRKFGGTGLGMFITKELIDMMGGSIEVKSKKGKGTEVKIKLQMPIGKVSRIERRREQLKFTPVKDAKVLLVEDNPMNRLVASNSLSQLEVNLTEVTNGQEAVEILKTHEFDLILMDIQMPVMDGMEAAEVIRNQMKLQTPIIALSANAFRSEINACKKVGMNDYVTKPFDEATLLKTVLKYLKSRDLESEASSKKTPKKLYDLSKLEEMGRGSDDFLEKMLKIFIDYTPKSVAELRTALEEEEIVALNKIAHRMKPSIDNLGINSLHEEVREIESFSFDEGSLEQLKSLVDTVCETLETVVSQLKANEL